MQVISYENCLDFIYSVMTKLGCFDDISKRWSKLLADTSLLGYDTHGIGVLDKYIRFIEGGGIDIYAKPDIIKSEKGCLLVDAKGGFGHIAADDSADKAVLLAKEYGISLVAVRDSNHIGACGLYTKKIASNNCIGMLFANAIPAIAPWGGFEAIIGINPVSIAAPVLGGHCFLLDFASSITAMGRITKHSDLGTPIPYGWALDKNGKPTNDPKEARDGSLIPIGEHKGYALAIAIEVLSALISNGEFSKDVLSWIRQTKKPQGNSFSIIAIDINAFTKPVHFKTRMYQLMKYITSSPVREGFERIYYPGEKEGETYEHRRKNGIPVYEKEKKMIREIAVMFELKKTYLDSFFN